GLSSRRRSHTLELVRSSARREARREDDRQRNKNERGRPHVRSFDIAVEKTIHTRDRGGSSTVHSAYGKGAQRRGRSGRQGAPRRHGGTEEKRRAHRRGRRGRKGAPRRHGGTEKKRRAHRRGRRTTDADEVIARRSLRPGRAWERRRP